MFDTYTLNFTKSVTKEDTDWGMVKSFRYWKRYLKWRETRKRQNKGGETDQFH